LGVDAPTLCEIVKGGAVELLPRLRPGQRLLDGPAYRPGTEGAVFANVAFPPNDAAGWGRKALRRLVRQICAEYQRAAALAKRPAYDDNALGDYFVMPACANAGEVRCDLGMPRSKRPAIPVEPSGMRRPCGCLPVELGGSEGLLGHRVGDAFAGHRILELREARKLLAPSLAHGIGQFRPEIAE